MTIDLFRLMADYNAWMNERIHAAAEGLGEAAVRAERGAFFGSILGTLNHIAVGDTLWLKRFAASGRGHGLEVLDAIEAPTALHTMIADDLAGLAARRRLLDGAIITWVGSLGDDDLAVALTYRRINGTVERKALGPLLLHFFNHQTHHRGQVTTLLSQAGVDVGVTDLLVRIPTAEGGEPGR